MFTAVRRKLRQFADLLNLAHAAAHTGHAWRGVETAHRAYRDWHLLTHPRYRDPKALAPHGHRVYSQTDEDGILAEIFRRLNVSTGTFVEFGVEDGTESNTALLLQSGWSGVWLEGSPEYVASIRGTFAPHLAAGRLTVNQAFITAENVESLFAAAGVPAEPTLLSIDIDGNDFWVWNAITRYRPLVVVVEYNADFGPALDWVMPYHPEHRFDGTRYFGASLAAFDRLGRAKGYRLVGCNWHGMNAFFVRDDLPADPFLAPFTAANHWEPARHYMKPGGGWPKDRREFTGWRPA